LSNAKIDGTAFRQVVFKECKMLGLRFDLCNVFLLSFAFDHCQLNFSSFYLLKIKNTQFRACTLQEVDFSECDLSKSSFAESDLSGAIFDQTNLEQADFATAYHFNIIPEKNKILKAKFSKQNIEGLLSHYKIVIE
jgi:fluoroquinolone resistance protein